MKIRCSATMQFHVRSYAQSFRKVSSLRVRLLQATVACSLAVGASLTTSKAARLELERLISEIKAKTAILVSAALEHRNSLSPEQQLAAPPTIWEVSGVLTEFTDCAGCPQMVIIPAGEFTMVRRHLSRFEAQNSNIVSRSPMRSLSASSKLRLTNGICASPRAGAAAIGPTTKAGDADRIRS